MKKHLLFRCFTEKHLLYLYFVVKSAISKIVYIFAKK